MRFWTKLRAWFQPSKPKEEPRSQRFHEIEAELRHLPVVTDGRENENGGLVSNKNRRPVALSEAARRIEWSEANFKVRAERGHDGGLKLNVGSFRETHMYTWYRVDEALFVENEYASGD